MQELSTTSLGRPHRARLMQLWRSAGWPCRDLVELDLLAAGLVEQALSTSGHDTLRVTEAGLRWMAAARQGQRRALSMHDRLADRVARQLMDSGRIVWRELSLRALVQPGEAPVAPSVADCASASGGLWPADHGVLPTHPARPPGHWRIARPDVFSVRNTSVEAYLQPIVHEVKVSRADLLSDLRHEAKRQAYQWLCCQCYYVFPASIGQPEDIPPEFGVWLLHGGVDDGRLELARPARHAPCTLPFPVWLALAKATPLAADPAGPQPLLADAAPVAGQDAPP